MFCHFSPTPPQFLSKPPEPIPPNLKPWTQQWAEIWRMQVQLGEKLLFAGEKKIII